MENREENRGMIIDQRVASNVLSEYFQINKAIVNSLKFLLLSFCFFSSELYAQITTLTFSPANDTYISSTLTPNSSPNAAVIDVLQSSTEGRIGLMDFNLSSIPYGSYISNASLQYRLISGTYMYSVELVPLTWNQSTVTWTAIPWSNNGLITDMALPVVTTPSINNATHNLVLTPMVSYMVYRKVPAGLKFLKAGTNTNLVRIASQNHVTVAYRPVLSISYYPPVNVSVNCIPASSASNPSGQADISVSGGSGNFSYQWYNSGMSPISNTQDLINVLPGLYALEIKDNTTNAYKRQYVIIANNEGSTTVNIQPNETFSEDGNSRSATSSLSGPPAAEPFRNYATENYLRSGYINFSTNTFDAFLKFNYLGLEESNGIQIDNAVLNLYGNTHAPGSGGTKFKIQRINQLWYEEWMTHNNRPTSTLTDEKDVNPGPSTSAPNVSKDITDFIVYHSKNPSQNYGYVLRRYATGSGPFASSEYVNFHSSSASIAANRPMLSITFRTKKDYCELKDKLDGQIYEVKNYLHFRYNELYKDQNAMLQYNIYKLDNNQLMANQTNLALPVKYGDNRYSINLKTIISGGLPVGVYLLEVINEKGGKQFLKFKVS